MPSTMSRVRFCTLKYPCDDELCEKGWRHASERQLLTISRPLSRTGGEVALLLEATSQLRANADSSRRPSIDHSASCKELRSFLLSGNRTYMQMSHGRV